jgi:hypothetical protein
MIITICSPASAHRDNPRDDISITRRHGSVDRELRLTMDYYLTDIAVDLVGLAHRAFAITREKNWQFT